MDMIRLEQSVFLELVQSVDPRVEAHWQEKIEGGIILTELLNKGGLDLNEFFANMQRLADFEAEIVEKLFRGRWRRPTDNQSVLHYFGVGTGRALANITPVANANNHVVIAYDICNAGYQNAETAFSEPGCTLNNQVYLADITAACEERYIQPQEGTKISLPSAPSSIIVLPALMLWIS
jgi:hypothetical protein